MKKLILLIWLAIGNLPVALAQQKVLDIPALQQLISQSEAENKLQVKAKDQQSLASANEQANLTLLDKLKKISRTLQQRYNTLGTAINVANIGLSAAPMVSRIVNNQSQIIQLAEKNPALIAIGFQSGLEFANSAKDLLSYVTGLTLAYGDVNQMKIADRKILFDYVLSELSHTEDLSNNMLQIMQYASLSTLLRAANPFQGYIDADQSIAANILQNAKNLK